MKTFQCACGNTLYFENSRCLRCGRELGFLPERAMMAALEPEGGQWRALGPDGVLGRYRKCNNYALENVCNWMVPAEDLDPFCASCRLNQVIPNLTKPGNRVLWQRVEQAKRRLLYDLHGLGLPVTSKGDDQHRGLAFEFLEDPAQDSEFSDLAAVGGVTTGHRDGVITINLAEAIPSAREEMRERMNERYRTLLGHFRHESGHYYWARLIDREPWLAEFRRLFGDERQDYGAALERHYRQGPPADWEREYLSAYAAAHPWEDWAETWAHYLHMHATLETADDYRISVRKSEVGDAAVASPAVEPGFDRMLTAFHLLSLALNALNRSMGLPDAYPFALAERTTDKLYLVHRVIAGAAER